MMRFCSISVLQSFFLTILLCSVVNIGLAQVRSSTNYQIQSDSLNAGGGYSSSTNFQQESTVGEIATGRSTSTSYSLRAGYQQMQGVFISLAGAENLVMDTALGGLTGGVSNASGTYTVITDSPSGYQLTIEAENAPAMQKGVDTITDYVDGGTAEYTFTFGATEALFGFTVDGVDATQYFLDSVGTCGSGSTDGSFTCWTGLSTSDRSIAESSGSNHPDGATTTVHFRVGIGGNAGVVAGEYYATTTVTALPL
jgi:hypothetical protein